MLAWKRLEPTKITKVGYRVITSKRFQLPDNTVATFDTVWPEHQAFSAVIALTPEKKVVIVRQFRPGPEKIMDELPGGFVDADETPEDAMRRELEEESGYKAGEVTYLGESHKDAYMNAVWHMFLATNCVPTGVQDLEAGEFVEVHEITIDQLIENARTDKMSDVVAVLVAYDTIKQLQEEP